MRGCNTKALSKEAPVSLVPSFVDLLQPFSCLMTVPTFDSLVTVLTGWVFARRRTISGMILAADAARGAKHHSAYHRLFAAARWSLDEVGLAVAQMLLSCNGGMIVLALDDTLCRKHGRKMFGAGMHHDPLISSRKMDVCNWGHSWVILGIVLRLPFCGERCWCLPVLFGLYRSKQTVQREGGSYRTRPQLGVQMLKRLCERFAMRRFHVLADMAYGGQSVLAHLPANCDLTSRLLLDARLVDDPPARRPGRPGRTALRGKPLPSPRKMLQQRATRQQRKTYGRDDLLRVTEQQARPYHVPTRKVKVVATESLRGSKCLRAYYSTIADASASAVLDAYAMRFSIEQTIQESKGHLGFEQPQNWSPQAVQRTAPVAMLLYTLILWWFSQTGHRHWQPLLRPWYATKRSPSLADMLATLRCQSVQVEIKQTLPHEQRENKSMKTLLHLLRQAA
jgi:DDE superfamily endonuclease